MHPNPKHRNVALGLLAVAVCALAATNVALSAPRYARTPTQSGAIDPAAIPLGDGYLSTSPKVGYVDSCKTTFRNGAEHAGSWIDSAAGTWDIAAKIAVSGAVAWPAASYKVTVANGKRTILFDDLPVDHTTGVFPIAPTDPAYAYDRNPNHIAAHATTWALPVNPKAAQKPSCVGLGAIGVLKDGVYLYNALDASGRDAAAHEVQDACGGHPDGSSSYHHHDAPPCIVAAAPKGKATLVGYARDGYGIYVVRDASGQMPTNTSLDACHGTTSVVPWNGKKRRVYHYVATLEYPYTVGCYHGTPNKKASTGLPAAHRQPPSRRPRPRP